MPPTQYPSQMALTMSAPVDDRDPRAHQVLARKGDQFPSVTVDGVVHSTATSVIAAWSPGSMSAVDPDTWREIRTFVADSLRATAIESPTAALHNVRILARYVAWAHAQGTPVSAPSMFVVERIEHYIATQHHLRPNSLNAIRGCLRLVGRTCHPLGGWAPQTVIYGDHNKIAPPYADEEIAGFWEAAATQKNQRRTLAITAILGLGLGCGLRSREMVWCTSADFTRDADHPGLLTLTLPDRIVPVRADCVDAVNRVRDARPSGPLFGKINPTSREPLTIARKGVELPARLPKLIVSRLRTTWAVRMLSGSDLRISEYQRLAGATSAQTLNLLGQYLPVRETDAEYLLRGAGLS